MEYEGRICTAPGERSSYRLPVTVGCAYNKCKFCGLFKDLTYREIPMDQIEAELQRVANIGGKPKVVYLGDGNAFHLETEKLVRILEMVHSYFPNVQEIRMDSTVPDILAKSDEELKKLADLKVTRLYLGIETALPDVLRFMNKCHTLPMAYEAIARIQAVGIDYAAHVMAGVAGEGRGIENAEALAKFINETKPVLVVNFEFGPSHMKEDIEAGRYMPSELLENIRECQHFLKLCNVENMGYDVSFGFPPDRIWGTLPMDREKMLAAMDRMIAKEYPNLEEIEAATEAERTAAQK